ncbi:DinB family protein [Mucilaginibacter robiniae]|uniref:DinB family protein n=1 Tax=Mucilaginibacter robiniae TaxID=2728022 RepID=A0A7L5E465_9SPHI|nr:DinB family protein [Mucilaginibacter robiniae]QJD95613.1 DinB family protein [Mucilaginibacter robiniae]
METAQQLQFELSNVFDGQPWYGTNINRLIGQVSWQTAYAKTSNGENSIAQIILHMIGYTEEVISRLQGNPAGVPARGDWPDAGLPGEQNWQELVVELSRANDNLMHAMQALQPSQWEQLINDQRGSEPVTSYKELIRGFIQHQIYHAGQIAILNHIHHVT